MANLVAALQEECNDSARVCALPTILGISYGGGFANLFGGQDGQDFRARLSHPDSSIFEGRSPLKTTWIDEEDIKVEYLMGSLRTINNAIFGVRGGMTVRCIMIDIFSPIPRFATDKLDEYGSIADTLELHLTSLFKHIL